MHTVQGNGDQCRKKQKWKQALKLARVPYLVVGCGDDLHALVTVPSGFLSPLGTKRAGEMNGRAVNYENKTSALWFGI